MSALKFMGSLPEVSAGGVDLSVRQTALLPCDGVQATPLVSDFRFPKVMTPDQLAEVIYRIRVFKIVLSWFAPATAVPGFGFDETGNVTAYYTSLAANERELVTLNPGFIPALPASSSSGTLLIHDPPAPDSSTPIGMSGQITHLSFASRIYGTGTNTGNYFIDPDSSLFLPRVEISAEVNAGTVFAIGNYQMTSPDPAQSVQEFTGSFLGNSMAVNVMSFTDHPITSLSFTVTGETWWAHENSEGPFWNTATGAALKDHRSFAL